MEFQALIGVLTKSCISIVQKNVSTRKELRMGDDGGSGVVYVVFSLFPVELPAERL